MNLVGQKVIHKQFGPGTVQSGENQILRVLFDGGNMSKAFLYPDAFEQFLTLENEALQVKMLEEIAEERALEERDREARRAEEELRKEEQRLALLEMAKLKRKTTRTKTTTPKSAEKSKVAVH